MKRDNDSIMRIIRNQSDPRQKILNALDSLGGKASLSSLAKKIQLMTKDTRDDAIESLAYDGRIKLSVDNSGGGRPKIILEKN